MHACHWKFWLFPICSHSELKKKKINFSHFSECCKFQHTSLQHEQNILFSSGKGAWYNNNEKCQGGSKCHTRGMKMTISLWSIRLIEIDPNV